MKHFVNKNLSFLRGRIGLSQEAMAGELDITRSALSSYEEYRSCPQIERLVVLADYFEVSIDDLIRVDMSKNFKQAISQQLIAQSN